ncbi:MAG TPA: MFS transporter [Bradyrhizobium sp.]|nr:MFS transporter [Bradyrhizobium sp.]
MNESQKDLAAKAIWPLLALNFFMADMQAGVGPFIGVFLLAHGWASGPIGSVMTLGGVTGMLITTPAGVMIDATRHKKFYVILPGVCTVVASGIILLSQNFWLVAASQVATALSGAAIVPAVTGITLGIVHQAGFNRQNGHNQVSNHAGNLVGAALSGFLGWHFGLAAVFWLAAGFGVLTVVSVLMIPAGAIDDDEARGLGRGENENEKSEIAGFKTLLKNRTLLILAAALACFHLGNGGMLPLYGLAVASTKQVDPSRLVATAVIVAQSVMIVVSLVATHIGEREGYWRLLLISFLALPIRGVVAALMINRAGVYPVEILDGIAAGLQTVVVPGLVARVLHRSGRVNAGQGAVMTIQGLGGALSPLIGGWLAQEIGYFTTFMILGAFALGSVALWLGFASDLRPACEKWGSPARRGERPAMATG